MHPLTSGSGTGRSPWASTANVTCTRTFPHVIGVGMVKPGALLVGNVRIECGRQLHRMIKPPTVSREDVHETKEIGEQGSEDLLSLPRRCSHEGIVECCCGNKEGSLRSADLGSQRIRVRERSDDNPRSSTVCVCGNLMRDLGHDKWICMRCGFNQCCSEGM
jgi:hypothetical protein